MVIVVLLVRVVQGKLYERDGWCRRDREGQGLKDAVGVFEGMIWLLEERM